MTAVASALALQTALIWVLTLPYPRAQPPTLPVELQIIPARWEPKRQAEESPPAPLQAAPRAARITTVPVDMPPLMLPVLAAAASGEVAGSEGAGYGSGGEADYTALARAAIPRWPLDCDRADPNAAERELCASRRWPPARSVQTHDRAAPNLREEIRQLSQ